jgi:hypothetical protein
VRPGQLVVNWQVTVHIRLIGAAEGCRGGAWLGFTAGHCRVRVRERDDLPGRLRRLGSAPGLGDDEQARVLPAAERAGERAAIEFNGRQRLAALAHPHAAPARDVGVPDRTLGVGANAVRVIAGCLCPHPPVMQVAVAADVIAGEPARVRVGHDQRGAVGGDRHAVGDARSSATWLTAPSAVTRTIRPGANSPPGKSKPMAFT